MIERAAAAAKRCGVDRSTLYRWSVADPRVRRAVWKRGWFVIERLAEAGLCPHPQPAEATGTPNAPLETRKCA